MKCIVSQIQNARYKNFHVYPGWWQSCANYNIVGLLSSIFETDGNGNFFFSSPQVVTMLAQFYATSKANFRLLCRKETCRIRKCTLDTFQKNCFHYRDFWAEK